MTLRAAIGVARLLLAAVAFTALADSPGTFRVVAYNLENYHLFPGPDRPVKSPASRAQVIAMIVAARPDLLAAEEVGSPEDLEDLAAGLKAAGLDLPHHRPVPGRDTNILIGVLSRFPFIRTTLHTNEQFLLDGRRFHTSRGFGEFDFEPAPGASVTVITAHLKSRRQIAVADEADLRFEEARILRRIVDDRLAADPEANLVVCGDFNDTPDSRVVRTLIGRGRRTLVDLRPAELATAPTADDGFPTRRSVVWTHFYAKEDAYTRIDYVLISPHMARLWKTDGSFVEAAPNWGLASDHRPVVAVFSPAGR
jgi:endonuclease/exonuclease/phosphatase family metal-dependent hydrolase